MQIQELVQGVRNHAQAHYEEEGWDYIVECFSDDDIAEVLDREQVTDLPGAIKTLRGIVRILDERRREVMAEVF